MACVFVLLHFKHLLKVDEWRLEGAADWTRIVEIDLLVVIDIAELVLVLGCWIVLLDHLILPEIVVFEKFVGGAHVEPYALHWLEENWLVLVTV